MAAYVAFEFALSAKNEQGTSTRAQLLQIEKSTGKRPEGLDGPDMPTEAEHVWRWFLDLHASRASGMGPTALQYLEIKAWSDLTRTEIRPWEARALKRIDDEWLKSQAKKGSTTAVV